MDTVVGAPLGALRSMTATTIKHGNFDSFASDYAQYPAILALGRPPREIEGTGIWTRMLAAQDLPSVTAIEPGLRGVPTNIAARRTVRCRMEMETTYLIRAWAARRTS
jgi:hypothetical protein